MDALLDFARGPLFRLSFAIMALGLLRILILDIWGIVEALHKTDDKKIPWKLVSMRTLEWFIPVRRVFTNRPIYSLLSILFHVGLLLAPIFLFAHIQLWRSVLGFGWPALPKMWADILTVLTIVTALSLFIGRVASRTSSHISRKQDYLWPLILMVPFLTGFLCANIGLVPGVYRLSLLIHILTGELIFVLIPFTKIAHCVIMPFSQLVATVAWKFPPNTDEAVSTTLNKKGVPV
jgi:nitrate reductase gamma subunit